MVSPVPGTGNHWFCGVCKRLTRNTSLKPLDDLGLKDYNDESKRANVALQLLDDREYSGYIIASKEFNNVVFGFKRGGLKYD